MKDRRVLTLLLALVLTCGLVLPMWGCGQTQEASTTATTTQEETTTASNMTEQASDGQEMSATLNFYDPGDGYTLKQVVVLSRHNIRAPLSTNGSALDKATPHTWINWTSNASELTMRGGTLETMTGEYVRKWLESEGLIPENYQPEEGAVRFYANGKQRTIATAQFFSSGMLPVANVDIETHADYDTMDPVFSPSLTFVSDSYVEAATKEIKDAEAAITNLADSYALVEDVVDYTESDAYKSGELSRLSVGDSQYALELGKEPAVDGSLKTACQLADALVLQYYEAPDATEAAFGYELTDEQWKLVSLSKDAYVDVLYTTPIVAKNIANPLLKEISSEMDAQGRKFTFLCGHDSNIASVLAALGVEEYMLEGAIETKTPIGSKVVFERWADADGNEYGRVRLIYQSVDQLRDGTMLSGYDSPKSVELSFVGIQKNEDGLYSYDDLRARITDTVAEYDRIVEEYGEVELDQAA